MEILVVSNSFMLKVVSSLFLVSFWLLAIATTSLAQGSTVQGPIECFSQDAAYETRKGFSYSDKGDYEKALAAYQRAARAEPTCAAVYNNLGTAYYKLERYQEAIGAFRQALQFNPSWGWICFYNIGRANSELGRLEDAVKAFSETIRLKPKNESVYRARGFLYLRLAQGDLAAADAESFLKLEGWRDSKSAYAVLLAHFAYLQAKRDQEARRVLDETLSKKMKQDWPFPVIRFLRSEIAEQDLLQLATDVDKMTEARAYLGVYLSHAGKDKEAREHLQWVKENGKKTFYEYKFALSELERIGEL